MTHSPSRKIGLERLRIIATEQHGICLNGTEFAPDELETRILELSQAKADFDFGAVSVRRAVSDRKRRGRKQGTRMLKVQCEHCGYVARVTSKWIEAKGPPLCPCRPASSMRCV